MADKTETGGMCGAAGDACVPEVKKNAESIASSPAKTENSEIGTDSEKVVLPGSIPSDDKNNLSAPAASAESGDAVAKPVDKVVTSEPEVTGLANGAHLTNLQEEVQKRTSERDNFEKKLAEAEKKLAMLQTAYEAATSGKSDDTSLRRELEELKTRLAQSQTKFSDRGRLMANQENQINALTKQVSSLKEVVAITKNLLEIRNMEVKHLQADVDSMENRITAERDRHNAMLRKMDAAVRLNADLKTEYETQLRLFQDLRGKYEEKVTLLTAENKAACAGEQPVVEPASQ